MNQVRFLKQCWSETRKKLDSMQPGDVVTFKRKERNNALTTVQRLQDAYGDRKYATHGACSNKKGPFQVRRIR